MQLIIAVVHVGAVKIYVAAVEAPGLKANVLFSRIFWNLTRFWTKLRVLVPCFPDFIGSSNIKLLTNG
jgi:hypothetical protein